MTVHEKKIMHTNVLPFASDFAIFNDQAKTMASSMISEKL